MSRCRDRRRCYLVIGSCIEYEGFPVIFMGHDGPTLWAIEARPYWSRGSAYRDAAMLWAHMLETGVSHYPGMPAHDFYCQILRPDESCEPML